MYRSTLTPIALLAITACGGQREQHVRAPEQQPVVTTAPATVAPPAPAAPVTYGTADSAFTARRYRDAAEMFDGYAKQHPNNAYGFYMLGLSSWKAGQLDRARGAFEDAIQRDPKLVKAHVNLSRVLLEQDHGTEALDRITAAIALDSGAGPSWRVLGRVEAHRGHVDDAIAAYKRAITLDSLDGWSMNNMGALLISAGRYADALPPLARAVEIDSGVATFQNNLGIALERTGYNTAAAAAYQRALDADSGYTKAQVSLARVTGRPDATDRQPLDLPALGAKFAAELSSTGGSGTTEP
jgi:tetratricopeptide (TPR) repeat protein